MTEVIIKAVTRTVPGLLVAIGAALLFAGLGASMVDALLEYVGTNPIGAGTVPTLLGLAFIALGVYLYVQARRNR